MMRDNRIRYYAMADYSDGAELDELIKAIIDRTAKNEALESKFLTVKMSRLELIGRTAMIKKKRLNC